MTIPVVLQLRSRPTVIQLGPEDQPAIQFRVEIPEVWDVVRVQAPVTTPVAAVKQRALEALVPDSDNPRAWVVKLGGFEVLDEEGSLLDTGVRTGSTLLITSRKRRPVR
jgi:hypothetical protein